MLALVTGGCGFVGSHLCERLLKEGHRVRILARRTSSRENLEGLPVEFVHGDLAEEQDLSPALSCIDWVFHVAGALKGFHERDLMRVNAEGTQRLVDACLAMPKPPSRFVLVSSLAAAGPSPGGKTPVDEDASAHPLTWYGKSKLAAERVVLDSALHSVILRPPIVFGPRDRDVYSYFKIARRGLLPIPGKVDRYYSLVFAPDLADGILRAAMAPIPDGAIINLAGPEVVSWAELGQRIALALGTKGKIMRIPEFLIQGAAHLSDLMARLRGRPEIFSTQKVIEMLAPAWVASPRKAEEILDWKAPTGLDEALAITVKWYRDNDWI